MSDITIQVGLQGQPGEGVPTGGTTGQFLKKSSNTDYDTEWVTSSATVNSIDDIGDVVLTSVQDGDILVYDSGQWINQAQGAGTVSWGGITGTLSNQTDLQTALNGKSDTSHNHSGVYSPVGHTHATSDITSGTFADARISQSSVTQHQAALSVTTSQISDFDADLSAIAALAGTSGLLRKTAANTWSLDTNTYLTGITGQSIKDLSDVYDSMTPVDGQALIYDTTNGWQAETLPSGVTDHGLLSGLADDDHTQYHNDARGDARYYTQSQIDTTLTGYSTTGHNHSGVYSPVGHTHTASEVTDFTTAVDARVTYETLNSNGDVGTSAGQLAIGNHTHSNYQEITTYNVQTTDATPTLLLSVGVTSGQEKVFEIRIHGHEDATNDHIWKKTTFCVKNVGGTASLVGGIDSATGYDAGAGTWTIVVGVSSGNATVTVTGEAAHTIDWRATLQLD